MTEIASSKSKLMIESSLTTTFNSESIPEISESSSCGTWNGDSIEGNNIRVVARLRPLSQKELNEESKESITVLKNHNIINVENHREFEYDAVFGPRSLQKYVYDKTAGDLIHNIFRGFNVTVLAYGQTGSGKTHTIFGENGPFSDGVNEDDGIIPRAVHDVFKSINKLEANGNRTTVEMSYLEIYNEEAKDLLCKSDNPPELFIRETKFEGVFVQNLSLHKVNSPHQISDLMEYASAKRATASTHMNAVSSRSHAICTLHVTITPQHTLNLEEGGEVNTEETKAKLTLVDLAGSERIKRTGAEGARMKEGININKGLFVLGQVVSALSELGQQANSNSNNSNIHIKYRDSKLTRLLQDSLGGNSKTVMVACISPADTNAEESLNTLRYAERTRNIKNAAVRNVVKMMSPEEAASLRRENQLLKLQLLQLNAKLNSTSTSIISKMVPETQDISALSAASDKHCLMDFRVDEKIDNIVQEKIITSQVEFQNRTTDPEMNVEKLNSIAKLRSLCFSLDAKLKIMEEKACKATDEALESTMRADKWQLKYEKLIEEINSREIVLKATHESPDIIKTLRNEIFLLKERLSEAEIDTAVSQATAAAILSSEGDIDAAQTLFNAHEGEIEDIGNNDEINAKKDKLTSELISMSCKIEEKEAMMVQMYKERECMEAIKIHFENAVKSLQDEVNMLSSERDILVDKMLKSQNSNKQDEKSSNDPMATKMNQRIATLEKRIKELKQKSIEHSRSLRLREQAEKKCMQLQADLKEYKHKRSALQRKLKEQSEERRLEKKTAKLTASRMLRDSQKLKYALNKVKEEAARQAIILRRKATEAQCKRKSKAEQERKRKYAASMKLATTLSKDCKEKLENWLKKEIHSGLTLKNMRAQIEDNLRYLEDSQTKKEILESQLVDKNSGIIHSLENEIELRSRIVKQIETNIDEIKKASSSNETANFSRSFTSFLDSEVWQALNRLELRFVANILFDHFLDLQFNHENIKNKFESTLTNSIHLAVTEEQRKYEKLLTNIKIQHSQEITDLLESTKETVEQKFDTFRATASISDAIEPDFKLKIDNLLSDYMKTYNKVGECVKKDLKEIKEGQDGMKKIMDNVASDLISQNEAAAIVSKKKKKDGNKKNSSVEFIEEDFSDIEDEHDTGAVEDSDDSDWNPDSPVPSKRRKVNDRGPNDASESTDVPPLGENRMNQEQNRFENLKVKELREMLREYKLPISGKKADLIERLNSYLSSTGKLPKSPSESSHNSDITSSSTNKKSKRSNKLDNSLHASTKSYSSGQHSNSMVSQPSDLHLKHNSSQESVDSFIDGICSNGNANSDNSFQDSNNSKNHQEIKKPGLSILQSPKMFTRKIVGSRNRPIRRRRSIRLAKKDKENDIGTTDTLSKESSIKKLKQAARRRSVSVKPLSAITNSMHTNFNSVLKHSTLSAKKRRRNGMAKSVNAALQQFEAIEKRF